MKSKGMEREKTLPRAAYFAEEYFRMEQLCSFAHQLHDIRSLDPKSILEVGVGNGFTATFLKRAGFDVVTVDINPVLEPDICAPINELPAVLAGRRFDLVVCCEVLEHIPFESFEENIRTLSMAGRRLYLTLPTYKRVFGFGGFMSLPKVRRLFINCHFEIGPFKKRELEEHCWEVGSSSETSMRRIVENLKTYYGHVRHNRYALNPYHLSFVATKSLA